jgi:hypothetical protein
VIPDIEIIPHIWGYWRLACLQLSGFVLWPPRCRVLYRPCVTAEDSPTMAVLNFFKDKLPATVIMEPHVMDRRRLMRRAIGRNECALTSTAPIVWFADCDYITTAACLDTILNNWPKGHKLAHPRHVHSCLPEWGMKTLESMDGPAVVPMNLAKDFPDVQRKRVAIGGLQFFDGDFCREKGYCGPKPRGRLFRPADRWQPTKCDKWARAAAGEDVTMNILALYRVRHTTRSEGHSEDARL